MTLLALASEPGRLMVGVLHDHRFGEVAGLALGGPVHELHLPLCRGRVTRDAVGRGMNAGERKARRLMTAHHRRAVNEASWGVAPGAVPAELSAVHVGVTSDAGGDDLLELQRPVARSTGRSRMGAFESESVGVLELAGDSRRLPRRCGVALGARRGQAAVRARDGGLSASNHGGHRA